MGTALLTRLRHVFNAMIAAWRIEASRCPHCNTTLEKLQEPGKAEARRCPNYCHGLIVHNRLKKTIYDDQGRPIEALKTANLNQLRRNESVG